MSETATISSLYRYPVKGLSPQALDRVKLTAGEPMPWDRAFAIENGPAPFDPQNPTYLRKIHFLMLMRDERLAELQAQFDEENQLLTLLRGGEEMTSGELSHLAGRERIEAFIADFMKDELKGQPRILSVPGHSFSDVAEKCLHLVNLASVRALGDEMERALDPLRFRANIYLDDADGWVEKNWVGKIISIGSARLRVFNETTRCAAADVDPQTAQRNTNINQALLKRYGHMRMGLYAQVVEGGTIRIQDELHIA
jgi:hypothetical protein